MNKIDYFWIESQIKRDFPLRELSTYRVGGPAEYYIEPEDEERVIAALKWAEAKKLMIYILGGGSNVLIPDKGLEGLVINTRRLNRLSLISDTKTEPKKNNTIVNSKVEKEIVFLKAQCGVMIDDLVDRCKKLGYSGFEEFAGLPGTVGGSLFMNARVYGKSIADLVETVKVFKKNPGGVYISKTYNKSRLSFGYKSSPFQKSRAFIIEAVFKLKPSDPQSVKRLTDEYKQKRIKMGQYELPNAGCVFKNNREFGKPTGMIIEELGLKGKEIGGAKIFEKHANFIVNTGNASARDIYDLIRLIEEEVKSKLGLKLEREIRLLGKWEN